jgi:tetratricopeptide (TPR) repeat protein
MLGGGRVVITSRISRWEGSVRALGLDLLSEEAAVAYLLERTAAGRQPQPDDEAQARGLALELGRLALALEQAAAYINARHSSFAVYRQRWHSAGDRLLTYHDALATHYPNSLAATWLTSFEQLTEDGQRLLRILAWLAAEPIPRTLLEARGGPFAAEIEDELPEDRGPTLVMDAEDALADLATYSLVSWSPDKTTFSVHGLVQEVTRRNQAEEEQNRNVAAALRWVNAGFVGDPQDMRNWPLLEPLAPHALVACEEADHQNVPKPTAYLMNRLGAFHQSRAEWREAERLMRRSVELLDTPLGSDDPDLAIALNDLAQLLLHTNCLAEAEPLISRALAIDEKHFPPEDPTIAIHLGNLASLLYKMGRLGEAEPLMGRALKIGEKCYGPEDPHVAIALNNFAQLLRATTRLGEAEPLMRRALAIDEKNYGPHDPNVAIDLNNLAQLLQDTKRPDEAGPLMRRALTILETSLGPEHPAVATQLGSLAWLLQDTNRIAEAEPLYRRALAIDEKSHGPVHPSVARDLNNLAQLLMATNRLVEAEPLMQRVVRIFLEFTRATGHPHPHLEAAVNNYVNLLFETGLTEDQIHARLHELAPDFFQ